MPTIIESVSALCSARGQFSRFTHSVASWWKNESNDKNAMKILVACQSAAGALFQIPTTEISENDSKFDIDLEHSDFWVGTLRLAAEQWESIRTPFCFKFALPSIHSFLSSSSTGINDTIETFIEEIVRNLVHLASPSDTQIWQAIFQPIPRGGSSQTSSSRKGKKKLAAVSKELQVVNWAIDELGKLNQLVSNAIPHQVVQEYLQQCIEYARLPFEVAIHRNEVVLRVIPRLLTNTYEDGRLVWSLLCDVLEIAVPGARQSVSSTLVRGTLTTDEERLGYEFMVRCYPWLLPDEPPTHFHEPQSTSSNQSPSLHTEKQMPFDARYEPLFFHSVLFKGLISADPVVRKCSIYTLKRMSQSPSNAISPWWAAHRVLHLCNPQTPVSPLDKFFLLFDSLEDHDLNIVSSMWTQFDEVLDACSDNLLEAPTACVSDDMVIAFIRRCMWTMDSKALKRWLLWQLLTSSHPSLCRLALNIDFLKDILREMVELIGEDKSRLQTGAPVQKDQATLSTASENVSSPASSEKITISSILPFLDRVVVFCGASSVMDTTQFLQRLIQSSLSDMSMNGTAICIIFSYLASSEHANNSSKQWPLRIFDAPTSAALLNALAATVAGYAPNLQYIFYRTSMTALHLHVDLEDNELPPILANILQLVPSYYRTKPEVTKELRSIVALLGRMATQSESVQSATSSTGSSSWLQCHITGLISSCFDPSTGVSHVPRSAQSVRTFDFSTEITAKISLLLSLCSKESALTYLITIAQELLQRLDTCPVDCLAIMTALFQFAPPSLPSEVWTEFLQYVRQSKFVDPFIAKLDTLLSASPAYEDGLKGLDQANELHTLLSAAAMIYASILTNESSKAQIEYILHRYQSMWADPQTVNAFELFASLGALNQRGAFHGLSLETLSTTALKLLEFTLPHHPSNNIDGPTWKFFGAKLESARWISLEQVCSDEVMETIVSNQQLERAIELCAERCQSVVKDTIPISMRVLKQLLSHLSDEKVQIESGKLQEWFHSIEHSLRQEKTFNRQVYHFMAAVLNPPLVTSSKYSPSVIEFMETVLLWAELSIGIANWLLRLIENALSSLTSIDRLAECATNLLPILFKLSIFGPKRAPGLQGPGNNELESAGFSTPPFSADLLSNYNMHGSTEQDLYLTDVEVRTATILQFALLLRKSSDIQSLALLYALGLNHEPTEAEYTATQSSHGPLAGTNLPLHTFLASFVPDYNARYHRKNSHADLVNYRRFQLIPFLSLTCRPSLLFSAVLPLMRLDHLVHVRELVTLSCSILVSRILQLNDQQTHHKLMSSLAAGLSDILSNPAAWSEDALFSWITLAGFVLVNIKPESHPHLAESFKHTVLLIMPFLSYNTLYVRSTTQRLFIQLLKAKLEWLKFFEGFHGLAAVADARPINKQNRRETFYYDCIKLLEGHKNVAELVIGLANELLVEQPLQLDLATTELALPPIILIDAERILMASDLPKESLASAATQFEPRSVSASASQRDESCSASSSSTTIVANDTLHTFQRKIVPWQSMHIGSESKKVHLDASSRQQIIVVASLLKKMPNLGGLTRTCEIFAASKLILPSMSVIKDKTFQDLSVSAEHWLPMEAVPEAHLEEYMATQKQNGYRLVGLEQTSSSSLLNEYKFPEKTLLLLGEEKHGIPVHLLQLLDDYVEIPQLGLIRSLNVHVSTSICIWEYTKQFLERK